LCDQPGTRIVLARNGLREYLGDELVSAVHM